MGISLRSLVFGLAVALPALPASTNFRLEIITALYEDGVAKLTWQSPPGNGDWYWSVSMRSDTGAWSPAGGGWFDNMSFNVRNLDTSTSYTFKVHASTRAGETADSDELTLVPKYRPAMHLPSKLVSLTPTHNTASVTIRNTGKYWSQFRVLSSDTSAFQFQGGDYWWPTGGGWIIPESNSDFHFRMAAGYCQDGYLALSFQLREAINPVVLTDTIAVEADCSTSNRRKQGIAGQKGRSTPSAFDLNGRMRLESTRFPWRISLIQPH